MTGTPSHEYQEWLAVNPLGSSNLLGEQPVHDHAAGNILTHDDFGQLAFDLEDTARRLEQSVASSAIPSLLRRMRDDALVLQRLVDAEWRRRAGMAAGLWIEVMI